MTLCKIGMEDIQSEIDYRNSSIYCYVGANPPVHLIEGFIRRIWKDQGLDKVVVAKKGIYMVQFRSTKKRDAILASNAHFFASKPMIMKPWTAYVDICKENIKIIPISIQLTLDFKY